MRCPRVIAAKGDVTLALSLRHHMVGHERKKCNSPGKNRNRFCAMLPRGCHHSSAYNARRLWYSIGIRIASYFIFSLKVGDSGGV